MKRIIYLITISLILSSCSGVTHSPEQVYDEMVRVNLSVGVDALSTKADAGSGEETVNNVILMVFSNTGQRVCFVTSDKLVFNDMMLPGKKEIDIYAIINSDFNFSAVTQLAGFKNTYSSFNSNTPNNFEMVGHLHTTLKSDDNLYIPVNRIAAKLVINNLKIHQNSCCNSDECSYARTHDVTDIYLTNVAASFPYSGERKEPASFLPVNSANSLTYFKPDYSYRSSASNAYERDENNKRHTYKLFPNPLTFYCYPNPSSTTRTRLIVKLHQTTYTETESGGRFYVDDCYHLFSIQLPELTSGTLYRIETLKIENNNFDSGEFNSDRMLGIKVSYCLDIIDPSGAGIIERIEKKEVVYAL